MPPTPSSTLSRRDFLTSAATAVTASALALGASSSPAASAAETKAAPASSTPAPAGKSRFPIIAFSKPFQKLNAQQTADYLAEIGWDGIECPIRAKGQIEPERAADEVPKFVEALRGRGKEIAIATTDVVSVAPPYEAVLRTLAKNGIKRVRLGFWRYDLAKSPADQLKEIAPALRDIAAACQELGLQAGFQNHSGRNYVGAPVWDVFSIIRDLDPKHIGMCFDIGHATIEGGLSWPIEAKLLQPYYTAVFVKDFSWKKNEKGVWDAAWCNLGEGMVNKSFFADLKKSSYTGPICQHHEYPLGDEKQMTAHFKKDLAVLQSWLA